MAESTILIVEDDDALREALRETLALDGHDVLTAAEAASALATMTERPVNLVVSDVRMPGMDGHSLLKTVKQRYPQVPVLMMTAFGTVTSAVEAMRLGAADYLLKPFDARHLITKVRGFLPAATAGDDEPIAVDPRMREIVQLAARVAASDATVMISGESGTGKEVLARLIHRRSRRAEGPFVAINCAAIPENMLEAILFGHEKGAFTGAVSASAGKFEQAQGGTLLLDEISEMPLALQAKLLRVLQEREVERLGSRKTIALDVRVLATTNRNLREQVGAGRFREDLYYRLNVFPMVLPPLRDRRDDILPLARHMLACHAKTAGRVVPRLSESAIARLLVHDWSGNVRELDNLIQRSLIMQGGGVIEADDLRFADGIEATTCASLHSGPRLNPGAEARGMVQQGSPTRSTHSSHQKISDGRDLGDASARTASIDESRECADSLGRDLRSREQQLIIEALRAGSGSRKEAAARLGISPRTLRYKLARLRDAGIAIPG
jgi:two-component system response regulator FlrC